MVYLYSNFVLVGLSIVGFSCNGHIDADLYEVFVKGGVFRRYAEASEAGTDYC